MKCVFNAGMIVVFIKKKALVHTEADKNKNTGEDKKCFFLLEGRRFSLLFYHLHLNGRNHIWRKKNVKSIFESRPCKLRTAVNANSVLEMANPVKGINAPSLCLSTMV